jgi:hypothetical protein
MLEPPWSAAEKRLMSFTGFGPGSREVDAREHDFFDGAGHLMGAHRWADLSDARAQAGHRDSADA